MNTEPITIELNQHTALMLQKYRERHPDRSEQQIIELALNAFLLEELMSAFIAGKFNQINQEQRHESTNLR